jgi:hypothetical protein
MTSSPALPFFPSVSPGLPFTNQARIGRSFTVGALGASFTHFYGDFLGTALTTVQGLEWAYQRGSNDAMIPVATTYVKQIFVKGESENPTTQFALSEPLKLSAGTYTLVVSASGGARFNLNSHQENGKNTAFLWASLASNPAGLSDGSIAGIVIGTVVGAALVVGGGVWLSRSAFGKKTMRRKTITSK